MKQPTKIFQRFADIMEAQFSISPEQTFMMFESNIITVPNAEKFIIKYDHAVGIKDDKTVYEICKVISERYQISHDRVKYILYKT